MISAFLTVGLLIDDEPAVNSGCEPTVKQVDTSPEFVQSLCTSSSAAGGGSDKMQVVQLVIMPLARHAGIVARSPAHMPNNGMYAPPAESPGQSSLINSRRWILARPTQAPWFTTGGTWQRGLCARAHSSAILGFDIC